MRFEATAFRIEVTGFGFEVTGFGFEVTGFGFEATGWWEERAGRTCSRARESPLLTLPAHLRPDTPSQYGDNVRA
eukprot:3804896-Rhodomonas_salina.1